MQNSKNKAARGFLSNAFRVAKKLSDVGLTLVSENSVAQQTAATAQGKSKKSKALTATSSALFPIQSYQNLQDMLRQHLPVLGQELLGRHYVRINKVVNWIAPQLSDQLSSSCFARLNQLSNQLGSVDGVLDQAGVDDLKQLSQDIARSGRLSQALAEQNKWLASVQGGVTGLTGVIGSVIDFPMALIWSLRTIYQVGRAYGFDLNQAEGQDVVQYVFNQIDLDLLAEKHTVLWGIKSISHLLQSHDIQQLQYLAGSVNDIEILKKWLTDAQGEIKWSWLNQLDLSFLTKLSPVLSASMGASYNWKLIEDVNAKAQHIFAHARQYLIQYPEQNISIIAAYEALIQSQVPQGLTQGGATEKIAADELSIETEHHVLDAINTAVPQTTVMTETTTARTS